MPRSYRQEARTHFRQSPELPTRVQEEEEEKGRKTSVPRSKDPTSLNEYKPSAVCTARTVCTQKQNRSCVQRDTSTDQKAGGTVRTPVILWMHHRSKVSTTSKGLDVGPRGSARPNGSQRQGASSPQVRSLTGHSERRCTGNWARTTPSGGKAPVRTRATSCAFVLQPQGNLSPSA